MLQLTVCSWNARIIEPPSILGGAGQPKLKDGYIGN
jgi:hypothetical protein